MAMIIDQPCVSCGVSLEKGVKIVSIVDIIKGSLGIMVSSVFLVYYQSSSDPTALTPTKGNIDDCSDDRENATEVTKERIEGWGYDGFWISLTVLIISGIDIILAAILFYSVTKKSVSLLHVWLIITGFLTPVNIFLIKIYEMIVVFAYTEDLTCEAGGKALEEFRKRPYVCNIKSQLYPMPVHGPQNSSSSSLNFIPNNGYMVRRPSTIYLTEKSFLMNVDNSVFSVVHHQRI